MSDKDVTTTSSQNQDKDKDKDKDNKIILEDLKEPLMFLEDEKTKHLKEGGK